MAEQARIYRENNPEQVRQPQRKYRKENPEKRLNNNRNYRKNNPEKIAHFKATRYARKKKAEGNYTLEEWETLKEAYNNRCAVCGKKTKLTVDHIIPLSKGG